jgi:endonuclease/exonuclease/phosphatase family metal-dependent hydrolase
MINGPKAIFLTFLLAGPAFATRGHGHQNPELRAMTQNLYVGADLFQVFGADPNNPLGIPIAVAQIYQDVLDSDFHSRATALAKQVAATDPDLIGLQEVSLIVEVDDQFQPVNYLDYLTIFLGALAAEGLNYEVAEVVENADVQLPALAGFAPGPVPILHFIALTDRDVILRRSDVTTSNAASDNYDDAFSVNVSGVDVVFLRGWTAVDAEVRGKNYHFVNTHLEVQGSVASPIGLVPSIQADQAQELIDLLSTEELPLVVVGDFNSSSEDPITQPYTLLTNAGYVDSWTHHFGDFGDGFTCCQDADLLNPVSALDERVDLIFVRNDKAGELHFSFFNTLDAEVTGEEPADKTPSGLWPSDHGGVAARLHIPACGLGFELAILLPAFMALRGRRRA